jgi:uncharacterized protein (DUF488 family)
MKRTIWTIGHSTRTLESFIALARHHGIEGFVDVRAFPGSRRHPHFGRERLGQSLRDAGFHYDWLGQQLGGRREPLPQSPNTGLRHPSFRGYADYMLTKDFSAGVDLLLARALERPTAFFCAELLWWKCHRSLIADYLTLARGWTVLHILDLSPPKPHGAKPEAHLRDGTLLYAEPSLFAGS